MWLRLTLALLGIILGIMTTEAQKPPTPDPTYGVKSPKPIPSPFKTPKWIWDEQAEAGEVLFFRRTFSLTASPRKAILHIACDDRFIVFVNGKEVSKSGEDPLEWRLMKSYEITPLLRKGKNVVAVHARNLGGPAALIALLELHDAKGKVTAIITDAHWKLSQTEAPNWKQPDFDDKDWQNATEHATLGEGVWGVPDFFPQVVRHTAQTHLHVLPLTPKRLMNVQHGDGKVENAEAVLKQDSKVARIIVPPSFSTPEPEPTPPPDVKDPEGWKRKTMRSRLAEKAAKLPIIVVDFGVEVCASLRVTFRPLPFVPKPVEIWVSTGETFAEAMELVNKNFSGPWRFVVETGKEIQTPNTAFRFAAIIVAAASEPVLIDAIVSDVTYYPVNYAGSFDCSDPLLTRLWYVGAYTVHICMQQDVWDAPKRDRLRWIGDLHVEALTSYYAFDDAFVKDGGIIRKTWERLSGDKWQGGHINGIPGYTLWWLVTGVDHYRFTGDKVWLKKWLPLMTELLDWFREDLDERGLFANKRKAWTFVDWAGYLSGEPELVTTHLLYVKALRDVAWASREVGNEAKAEELELLAQAALEAANTHWWRDGFTQLRQPNALAVYANLVKDNQRERAHRLLVGPKAPPVTTPYYNAYVLLALAELGEYEFALKFIRNYWGEMHKRGATTFWEVFDPNWEGTVTSPKVSWGHDLSLSHGWSSAPTFWLSAFVLGVQPSAAGYQKVQIAPHLCDLRFAKGTVPTPRGVIAVEWRREDKAFTGVVRLPKGITVICELPKPHPGAKALVDNKPVKPVAETKRVVVFTLKGGATYQLTVR